MRCGHLWTGVAAVAIAAAAVAVVAAALVTAVSAENSNHGGCGHNFRRVE